MPGTTPETRGWPAVAAYVPPAAAALGQLVVGVLFAGETWGAICIGSGLLGATIVGLCAAFGLAWEAVYGVLFVMAVALAVAGAVLGSAVLAGLGVLAFTVVGASAPIAFHLRAGAERRSQGGGADAENLRDLLERILENSMLSDNARRVLFRERELRLLRDAIEADIAAGKYSAALTLCTEMAEAFGYRNEAEAFRGRIEQARQARYEQEARAAIERLDELLGRRDWAMVHREAARIRRLYGDSHLVEDLEQRIVQTREQHKRELEARFLDAARGDDVGAAMALLKELDRYLDRAEAERLSEVAGGIVARHRSDLGAKFKLAVSDRQWADAARVGAVIVEEFPNSKMAEEVRSMIDVLRTRATQAALAERS